MITFLTGILFAVCGVLICIVFRAKDENGVPFWRSKRINSALSLSAIDFGESDKQRKLSEAEKKPIARTNGI